MIRVRALKESECSTLKFIRLQALQADPGVFSSNYAKEAVYDESAWQSWLTNADRGVFGVFDGENIIGMTGIAIDQKDPARRKAILWGSWLEPSYRGQGLSRLMYEARLDWARNHPTCETVEVSQRASNVRSKQANQKHSFVFTHAVSKTWPDGGREDDVFYELRVKPPAAPPAAS